ncbi:hypothetical protein [Limnoglobus roseus]|uniref:PEP-CTERM sorting domain-containing protein n=1 Tax=Limnoglobus roseus TaxID=2598579 RepID=A0A5C1ACG6_9BACT|nr:hypothetical protein [Limnoglobus roseus]QEL17089.1 hypothetical protein PX52LOC_04065 [Limnoglobus roseus]
MKTITSFLSVAILATLAPVSRAAFMSPYLDYDLRKSSYADLQGNGPALSSLGGGMFADGGYAFSANQGLTLSNGLTGSLSSSYSIALLFEFDQLNGYRKILDFKNRSADAGLYNLNTAFNFYPFASSTAGQFTAGTSATVVLTRDAMGNVVGYVNGSQQISFLDSSSNAVFNAMNNVATFFTDDSITNGGEAPSGTAFRIQVYQGALSSTDVAGLNLSAPSGGGAVVTPGPGGLLVGLIGMGCLTPFVRRRAAKTT